MVLIYIMERDQFTEIDLKIKFVSPLSFVVKILISLLSIDNQGWIDLQAQVLLV